MKNSSSPTSKQPEQLVLAGPLRAEEPYSPPGEGPAVSRGWAQEQVLYTSMVLHMLARRLWRVKATCYKTHKKPLCIQMFFEKSMC